MKINILFKYLAVFVLFYSFYGNAEVIGYKKDELDTKLCASGRLGSINGISWDIKGLGKLYLYNFRYETESSLNSFDDRENKADKNMELIGNVNRYINVFDFHLDPLSTFVEPIKDEFSFYGDVIFISKNKDVDMFWLNKNKNATLASDILLTTSEYDGGYIGDGIKSYQQIACENEVKEFELKNVDEVYYIRENITNNTPFFIKLELKNKTKMTFELKTKGLIDLIKKPNIDKLNKEIKNRNQKNSSNINVYIAKIIIFNLLCLLFLIIFVVTGIFILYKLGCFLQANFLAFKNRRIKKLALNELVKLVNLKEQGAISEEEFNILKEKLKKDIMV